MPRKVKSFVDYFPHDTTQRKTIFILKNQFQHKGYTFWFQLLEILGQTPGHYYDLNPSQNKIYFQSYQMMDWEECETILNLLADLGAIDPKLYKKGILWCDNFAQRISYVYVKRNADVPTFPEQYIEDKCISATETEGEDDNCGKSAGIKGIELKELNNICASKKQDAQIVNGLWDEFWLVWPKKKDKAKAKKLWDKISNKKYPEIIEAVKNQIKSGDLNTKDLQYCPLPTTWLRNQRWNDELSITYDTDDFKPPIHPAKERSMQKIIDSLPNAR